MDNGLERQQQQQNKRHTQRSRAESCIYCSILGSSSGVMICSGAYTHQRRIMIQTPSNSCGADLCCIVSAGRPHAKSFRPCCIIERYRTAKSDTLSGAKLLYRQAAINLRKQMTQFTQVTCKFPLAFFHYASN